MLVSLSFEYRIMKLINYLHIRVQNGKMGQRWRKGKEDVSSLIGLWFTTTRNQFECRVSLTGQQNGSLWIQKVVCLAQ